MAIGIVVVMQAVPAILSATTRKEGEDWSKDPTASQPAGAVFAIIWPILYLCLAAAIALVALWPVAGSSPIARWVVLALLAAEVALNWSWIPTYGSGNRKGATWVLLAMLLVCAPALSLSGYIHPAAQALIAPYCAWLVFALVLTSERNVRDVAQLQQEEEQV